MTTYYVDPGAGSNTSPYDTWAKAATDLQTITDLATAGDICYCRGTQTISAAIDFDTNSGSESSGYIKFIGCNASGDVDGTRFVLDCSTSTNAGIVCKTVDYVWLENIEISSSATTGGADGIDASTYDTSSCAYWNFINVYVHGFDGSGLNGIWFSYPRYIGCRFSNNDIDGIEDPGTNAYAIGCVADNNGTNGFDCATHTDLQLYYCLAYENSGDGFKLTSYNAPIVGCVAADNTGDGFDVSFGNATLIGCRSTNNANGLVRASAGQRGLTLGCYIAGNTTTQIYSNCDQLAYRGDSNWNHTTDTDRQDGYVDPDADDYNLRPGATLRSKAFEMPE